MTLAEWLVFIAVIDGPVVGMLYFIWKRLRQSEDYYESK